jgi:heme A synthase
MSNSLLTLATGVFLLLAGAIWMLQGLDVAFAPQSFMTDNRWWVLWGAIAVVLGVLLTFRSLRE